MKDKIKQYLKARGHYRITLFIRRIKAVYFSFQRFFKRNLLQCKKVWFYAKRSYITDRYLNTNKIHKLQLGGGKNILKGWLNADLMPCHKEIVILDVTKPFFFGDQTFDYIFCEHMIEHISYNEGLEMLKECLRVLKENGKIRISTPDLQVYLDCFNDNKSQIQKQYLNWLGSNWLKRAGVHSYSEVFALNLVMHGWGHKFIYDFETLKDALIKAGFSSITRVSAKLSDDKNLNNIGKHGDSIKNIKGIEEHFGSEIDNQMNEFSSLTIEAVK